MRGCESCTNPSHLSGRNRAAVVELVDAFPSLNDCVARVGEANFVSKFDLLLAGAFDQAC